MHCLREELLDGLVLENEEENIRFLLLVDCNHVIESKKLEAWFKKDADMIKFKECPVCETPIKKTHRFNELVKRTMRDIAAVKLKFYGNEEKNNQAFKLMLKLTVAEQDMKVLSLCKSGLKSSRYIKYSGFGN